MVWSWTRATSAAGCNASFHASPAKPCASSRLLCAWICQRLRSTRRRPAAGAATLCLAQARIATITNSIGSSKKQHQQHPPRVAQVQGVLAQHEAGLERYTGTEVSDALLLVDGLAAVLKDMGTASPRCYALAHCEEQRRAPHVAARWVEVPRWILEISCTFPRNALFLQMSSGLRDTAAHVVCFDEANKPERHVQTLDGLAVFRSAPVCIGHGSHGRRVSAGGDSG